MSQIGSVITGPAVIHLHFPDPDAEALSGLAWGSLDAFPSPAYWAYQVLARRLTAPAADHRLGDNLVEEVTACLLGGHGIPADVGVAAFHRLRSVGALEGPVTEAKLLRHLCEPLEVNGRVVRYRFAKQKARYLAEVLHRLRDETPPIESGRVLRDWVIESPGFGFKTASWVARNWLRADDVAILDIHVLRAGTLGGFLDPSLKVDRHYLRLEAQFLRFSGAIGVRPSELDAVIWGEMRSSPTTVRGLMEKRRNDVPLFRA